MAVCMNMNNRCYKAVWKMYIFSITNNSKGEKTMNFINRHLFISWMNMLARSSGRDFNLMRYTLRKLYFQFLSHWMGYDRGAGFLFDFEPNGNPFGSKSKGKLSPWSYPIQYERKWKYSFLSVEKRDPFHKWANVFYKPKHSTVIVTKLCDRKITNTFCINVHIFG